MTDPKLRIELAIFDDSRLEALAGDDPPCAWAREGFMARPALRGIELTDEIVKREAAAMLAERRGAHAD